MKKYIKIKLKNGEIFEGILINETKDFIILKLDNGYNIGIKNDDIENIETNYINDKKIYEIRKKDIYNKNKISIIATGGTILSKVDYRTGGVHMLTKPEELLSIFPELFDYVDIKSIEIPFSIASEDITPKEWIKIAKTSEKLLNDNENKGIIIMHGTDTMHFTSSALSFMLRNLNKPVALTGSQRSSDRPSSDAFFNIISSSVYSLSDIAEVSVVMHGDISDNLYYAIRGTKVRKMNTERRDAFKPINDKPLAKIIRENNKFILEVMNNNYRRRNDNLEVYADTNIEEKVALIKVYPGSDPEIIDFYVDKGYKGIVIEGTGFGHVPTQTLDKNKSFLDHIRRGIENNVIFVMTSQTIYGRTNPFVYSNARILYELGVIYAEDILPEVAYTKLIWILGHTNDYNEVKKLMLTNIAGEISERSLY